MSSLPIGLQLFSVREEVQKDLAGTLQAVARMGYQGVEFWATPSKFDPAQLRELLDRNGLQCCGWHCPYKPLQEENLPATLRFMQTLGATHIVAWLPAHLQREQLTSREAWREAAQVCTTLAARLKGHGLRVGYHNHDFEFRKQDGFVPWDLLAELTTPDVFLQLDTGNALCGGADLLAVLRKTPGRIRTIHLKPYSLQLGQQVPAEGFRTLIGEDDVPWRAIVDWCGTQGGTEWLIVEQEGGSLPPLKAVEACLRNLRGRIQA